MRIPKKTFLFSFFYLANFYLPVSCEAKTPGHPSLNSAADPQVKTMCEQGLLQQKQLGFVENKGQLSDINGNPAPYVLFKADAPDLTIWVTTSGLTYQFYQLKDEDHEKNTGGATQGKEEFTSGEWHRVDMLLKNASIQKENILPEGDLTQGRENHYTANYPHGIFDVKKYEKLTVKNIYPGIDWVLYTTGSPADKPGLKYDLIVHPGADPAQIKLIYEGSGDLDVRDDQVHFKNELGEVTEGKLFCYQGNKTTSIPSHYASEKTGKKIKQGFSNEVSILVPGYVRTQDLVIDPQLSWSSYFGGSSLDGPISICRDNSNNIYFTGYESSVNFPVLNPGGGAYYQGTLGNGPGVDDLMIVKLNNAGVLLSSTYYGGSAGEEGTGITCDALGQLFVTGQTASANFPLFNPGGGAYFQNVLSGPRDLFILRFSATGALTWATFYGGSQYEDNGRIVTDNSGNICVLGATGSNNIPLVNPGGGAYFQAAYGGGAFDAFILKFSSACVLQWATYYGGTGQDDGLYLNGGTGIDVSAAGEVFICGYTNSGASFPIQNLPGAYNQAVSAGSMEAFILKFNNAGVCQWATFLGGGGNDYGFAIHCGPSGNLYVTGNTNSVNLPVVNPGGGAYFQGANGGGTNDIYIAEFNSSGALTWCTYYGGSGLDGGYYNMGIAKDGSGNLFICGYTNSTNLPLANPGCNAYYQSSILGNFTNAFIAEWSTTRSLVWATYFGGNFSSDLVVDGNGCLFVNGESNINGMTTLNPGGGAYYQTTFTSDEGFIIKLCPSTSLSVSASSVNVLCNGQCTGTATATPTGCSSPFTYSWNSTPAQTTSTATGLCAGSYTVVVTDASSNTVTASVTITQPTAILIGTGFTPATCSSNTGTATATPSGGTPGYTYSWNNSQTSSTATGLGAGTYTVVVTDANGCTQTQTVTVTSSGSLSASLTQVDAQCNAQCNGSALATPTSGTAPYTYSWSNSQTSANATGLCAGTYTVTITDANGCSTTQTVTINQPSALSATPTQVNICCNGSCNGSASVNASGGTPGYAYSWSSIPSQTTQTATGLCAGNYTCTITDGNGCTITQAFILTQPPVFTANANASNPSFCTGSCTDLNGIAGGGIAPYTYSWAPGGMTNDTVNVCPTATTTYTFFTVDSAGCCTANASVTVTVNSITITPSSTPAACSSATGTATATPSGGTSPYTYSWNNGQTNQTATGLAGGTYTVTVTDANGCSQTQTVTVSSSSSLSLTLTSTPAGCTVNNGTATATPTSGTSPYTYSWSNGQTTQTATALAAGNYTVVVTDANGCSQTQVTTVGTTGGPTASANASPTSVSPGGNSQLNATGGGTYSWFPSTGLSCITCANPVAAPAQSTSYCVVVTDANGCSDTACITITVDVPCLLETLETLLPNAFSPNNDANNDQYCVPANVCVLSFVLKVYDRWGEKVFESSSLGNCWDGTFKGKTLNTDVFVYYFEAQLSNGEHFSQKGNISLIK